ncbi:MAG: low molecular weight protein-tyrosine-phosphatase [Pseudomonadota bacterium]
MTTSVLFVCLGNICRSPTAEAVMRKMAEAAGLPVTLDSAGTSDWHIGNPPYGPAIAAGKARGYDLAPLRARQITPADFDRFDHIVAMDQSNLQNIEALRPPGNATPVTLFLPHGSANAPRDVPDPYYTRDFEGALDLIEDAAAGLVAQLSQ